MLTVNVTQYTCHKKEERNSYFITSKLKFEIKVRFKLVC